MPCKMEIQDLGIETELAFRKYVQNVFTQSLRVPRNAVCRQAHDNVLIVVGSESKKCRDRRIELT